MVDWRKPHISAETAVPEGTIECTGHGELRANQRLLDVAQW